mgnify:CR=1 FL=1
MVKLVGGVPVPVEPEDGSFIPRIQDIEQVIGSYTKAVIINSPNNPSGAMYSEQFIADIVELCEKRGLYLIMDDIYHKLVFDKATAPSAYKFTKEDVENSHIILVNGVAKLYGMTGYRIGWTIAPKKLVEVMINVQRPLKVIAKIKDAL